MPNFVATSCHVFSPISGNCEPTWFISLRRLSRHSRASPLDVRGMACVCSILRRIAEYQSAARTCWSASCANPKKAWIPAKTAASRLIAPTTILSPIGSVSWLSVAKRLVPTAVVRMTTGRPSSRWRLRRRSAIR